MENEENEQSQQTSQKRSNSNVSEKVNNIGNTAKGVAKVSNKLAQSPKMQKVASQLAKLSKTSTKVAKVAAKFTKIIATVGWIILIVIIVIGLLVFILTGLGFIINGLKSVASTILSWFDDKWDGQEYTVNESAIIETADYLEEMGYDLFGYGFVGKEDAFNFGNPLELPESSNNKDTDVVLSLSTSTGTYAYDSSCYSPTYEAYNELIKDISNKEVKTGSFNQKIDYAQFFVNLIKSAKSDDDVNLKNFDENALIKEIKSKEIVYQELDNTNDSTSVATPKSSTIRFKGITDDCGNEYEFILKDWYITIKYSGGENENQKTLTEVRLNYHASLDVIENDKSNVDSSKEKKLAYEKDDEAYKYLFAYQVSDNYAKCIKNSNKSVKRAIESFSKNFLRGINSDNWGTGLISIYYDTGKIGEIKEPFGVDLTDMGRDAAGLILNPTEIFQKIGNNWDKYSSDIDVKDGYLVVNNPGVMNDVIFKYKIDGWIGRYGMPLEFLLATHVATMAPDLSLKLATSFDTDVEILLHSMEIEKIDSRITVNGATVTYDDIDENNTWLENIADDEAYDILHNTPLKSVRGENVPEKYSCTGIPENTDKDYGFNTETMLVYDIGSNEPYKTLSELKSAIEEKKLKIQVSESGNKFEGKTYYDFLIDKLQEKLNDKDITLTEKEKDEIIATIKKQDIDYWERK